MIKPGSKPRKCGSCNLCCHVFNIEILNKPSGTACQHLAKGCTTKSCTIYDRRPEVCAGFRCLWLDGLGPNNMRPDRSGVVLLMAEESKEEGAPVIVHGHALKYEKVTAVARRFMDTLITGAIVVLVAGDKRRLLGGPRAAVAQIMARLKDVSS